MDSTGSTGTAARRANVYLEATETAATEAREIRTEIAALEARVVTMRGREATLHGLVEAMRPLLPAPADPPARAPLPYAPVEMLDARQTVLNPRDWDTEPAGAMNGTF